MQPIRTLSAGLAGLLLATAPVAAQKLTPVERRMAEHAAAHREQATQLLQRLVDINSGTLNRAGNEAVARLLIPELEALGFEARYEPQPDALRRAGHLIARREGTRGKKVLLIGHLDTVFEEDSPFQRFTLTGDSAATGPGVVDMKGGDVVIVQALRALDAAGALEGADITVVMTGDEESPGRPLDVARRALIDAGRHADVALGFEGGSRDEDGEYAVVARRSSSGWQLTVTGRRAHSSGIFSERVGAGAIFEAARILDAFYDELRGEEFLTFNAGVILGGSDVSYDEATSGGTAAGKTNVVPERVEVRGGLRTISEEQLESARERMRAIVARSLPRTSAEIRFGEGYPAMAPTDANYALLEELSAVSQALGYGALRPFDPGGRGAADISFVAPYVEAGLDGLGPHGSGSHSVQETLDLASLVPAIQRAAILIHRLTTGDRP